jgi:hypothetical protein
MHDRRSVLKTVAGIPCLGIVNTVGANDQNQYEEIGQVFETFTDDSSDGVRQVMKSRGLDHSLSTDKKIEDTESGPAPYDYHWQDNSDIYVNAFNVDGKDRIRVQAMAGLKTVRPSTDSVAVVPVSSASATSVITGRLSVMRVSGLTWTRSILASLVGL